MQKTFGKPIEMIAKYTGICKTCHNRISKGQHILFFPKYKQACCPDCRKIYLLNNKTKS